MNYNHNFRECDGCGGKPLVSFADRAGGLVVEADHVCRATSNRRFRERYVVDMRRSSELLLDDLIMRGIVRIRDRWDTLYARRGVNTTEPSYPTDSVSWQDMEATFNSPRVVECSKKESIQVKPILGAKRKVRLTKQTNE